MIPLLLALLLTQTPEAAAYPARVRALAATREALADRYERAADDGARREILGQARAALLGALDEGLLPAWYGTRWAFYGTSETPGQGTIACGYFVSTVLRDAGLRVERVRLAQQASERIVTTLAPPDRIARFRGQTPAQVVARTRERFGDGLYVVGLDYHVALLRLDGERARLCHSAVFEPAAVVCEPAEQAQGMVSGYHVLGQLFTGPQLVDWLRQRPLPTR